MYDLFEKLFHYAGGEGSPPHGALLNFLSVSICIKFQPQSNQEFNYFSDAPFASESIKQKMVTGGIFSGVIFREVEG